MCNENAHPLNSVKESVRCSALVGKYTDAEFARTSLQTFRTEMGFWNMYGVGGPISIVWCDICC
jgi:hypothetical protein